MKRTLLQAAVYRKMVFYSEDDLLSYLDGGIHNRWLVSRSGKDELIVAVIGESYNSTAELKMMVTENEILHSRD